MCENGFAIYGCVYLRSGGHFKTRLHVWQKTNNHNKSLPAATFNLSLLLMPCLLSIHHNILPNIDQRACEKAAPVVELVWARRAKWKCVSGHRHRKLLFPLESYLLLIFYNFNEIRYFGTIAENKKKYWIESAHVKLSRGK